MSDLFYGVAYYDEYMPEDRLAKDIALMRETGINVVRIAESTWSTLEPQEGEYNFYHIDRVLEAMHEAGIAVIVGTPTYAVPAWLAAKHPDILVTTVAGQQKYGPRQIMDIVNPTFRRYAEKIIRTLMAHVQHHPAIIGWQLDNETKHYDNIGRYMQEGFVRSLQEKYPDLRQLNHDFGLDYWSNRIDRWQEVEFHPSHVRIWTGAMDAGQDRLDNPAREGFHMRGFHGVTPETETSAHYFWTIATNPHPQMQDTTQLVIDQTAATFEEDKVVIEAQFRNQQRFGSRAVVDIHVDVGPNRARRVIERLRQAGAQASQALA